jgi:hypothetical protein
MIPNNSFTAVPVTTPYAFPMSIPYSALSQTIWGGTALSNSANGRMVQLWSIWYDGTNINVSPSGGAIAFSIAESGVSQLSLAFDENMNVAICWLSAGNANLYYYDTVSAGYITLTIPATSCVACIDDPASFYSGQSDVIFSYTRAGNLYYRQQRDRYTIERLIGPCTTKLLRRVGLSTGNRLQFELF